MAKLKVGSSKKAKRKRVKKEPLLLDFYSKMPEEIDDYVNSLNGLDQAKSLLKVLTKSMIYLMDKVENN